MNNLWLDNTTLGGDFATVVYRAQLLGFNAVRLPFRFSDLNMQPKNWTFACKPKTFGEIKVCFLSPKLRTLGLHTGSVWVRIQMM